MHSGKEWHLHSAEGGSSQSAIRIGVLPASLSQTLGPFDWSYSTGESWTPGPQCMTGNNSTQRRQTQIAQVSEPPTKGSIGGLIVSQALAIAAASENVGYFLEHWSAGRSRVRFVNSSQTRKSVLKYYHWQVGWWNDRNGALSQIWRKAREPATCKSDSFNVMKRGIIIADKIVVCCDLVLNFFNQVAPWL